MEISLVNPNTRECGRVATTNPPMGLLYIASVLRDGGFEPKFIDADVDNLSDYKVLSMVSDSKIVGITMTTMQATAAYRLAEAIKACYGDDKIVVAGGSHPSGMKERIFDDTKGFDYSVVGEGEQTMLLLAKRVKSRYVCKDKILLGTRLGNLDVLPFPAVDLAMPISRYNPVYPANKGKMPFPVMASRGCPFRCKFCGTHEVWGYQIRRRQPKKIVDEVEWLKNNFGVDEIYFLDDGLNYNLKWCSSLLVELMERRLNETMWFKGSIRGNEKILPPVLVWQFKRSGFWSLALGVESGNQRIRDTVCKQLTDQEIIRAFKLLRQYNINITASFMIGHIEDTQQTIMDTINFALKLNPDQFDFPITTPLPSTEVEKEADALGLIRSKDWKDYAMGKAVMDTKYVKAEMLEKFRDYAFKQMYEQKQKEAYRRNPLLKVRHYAGNILRKVF